MTVEMLNSEGQFEIVALDKLLHISTIMEDGVSYLVARILDGDTVKLFYTSDALTEPDEMEPDAANVLLLFKDEITHCPVLQGIFRWSRRDDFDLLL